MSTLRVRHTLQEFVFPASGLLVPLVMETMAGDSFNPRVVSFAASLFMAIAVVPLWFYARGLRRRIGELAGEFEDMSRGTCDLTRRLPLDGDAQSETYRLAQGFNALMERLQDTVRAVMQGAEHLAGTAGKMAAASSQLAVASNSQRDAAASTAAAVEQCTTSINHVADQTRETAEISRHASTLSARGEQVARETAQGMSRIAESMRDSARLIASLSQHSQNISGIVKVIKDIAEQTNLLALNAAIEAARAGEQGRGFAVVADEVRKLAERTATATSEISGMIEAIQTEVTSAVGDLGARNDQIGQAVSLAEQVASALAEINEGARKTQTRIEEITNAASEQGAASNQIAGNIERMAQMAETNSAAVAEAANSARYVDELATQLHDHVVKFRV
jgi:methyl-accepting chemotaxis protein